MSIVQLTTVAGLNVSATVYTSVFTSPAGWSVACKPTGLYDIYNPSNQLVSTDCQVPFIAGMDRDPRDCLGYVPDAGTPPPALLSSSEAGIKIKSSTGLIKNKPVKKGGFVVTAGGWLIRLNADGTFIRTSHVSGVSDTIFGTPHLPDGTEWHRNQFPPKPGFH